MATGGETCKRKQFSFKQRVSHRKFRIGGAVSFADGSLRSAANRLEALVKELPQEGSSCKLEVRKGIATINMLIAQLRGWRMDAIKQAERAEEQASGTTNSGSA